MLRRWLCSFVIIAACCSCQTTQHPPSPVVLTLSTTPDAELYFSKTELLDRGYSLFPVDTNQTLVCANLDITQQHCFCWQPLPCEEQGNCIRFDENIQAFKHALQQNEAQVECQHADIGTCGAFTYFHFRGDIRRREIRWYDPQGVLIGQRNEADYPAYCDNKASISYQGKIPKCPKSEQTENLCGTVWSLPLAPLDSLGF